MLFKKVVRFEVTLYRFTRGLVVVLAFGFAAWFLSAYGKARMKVVGFSMAPGVRQGDQVEYSQGQGPPHRYERVVCQLVGGQPVLKRLMGLGGEHLCCREGELFIDGVWQRKNIKQLASLGIPFIGDASGLPHEKTGWFPDKGGWCWLPDLSISRDWLIVDQSELPHDYTIDSAPLLYDDSPWLPIEKRRLERVSDAGLAVVIKLDAKGHQAVEICLQIGKKAARVLVQGCGYLACVAGQLDGRIVTTAWPVGGTPTANARLKDWLSGTNRSVVPPDSPDEWNVVESLPPDEPLFPMAISAQIPGSQSGHTQKNTHLSIARLVCWRDIQWLPHPNGQHSWTIPEAHIFLLGDCPAASKDSRHWGPLPDEVVLGVVTSIVGGSQD